MAQRLLLSTPHMSDAGYEMEYIQDAFEKNWVAPLGENVNEFEKAMEGYLGWGHAVALSAGTAALHMAIIEAGVGPGDLVFCQSLTFSASANPIVYQGAKPVFIDSEPDSWNMDPDALEKAIGIYGVPKAVVAVHLYGNPAKMDRIVAICQKHGITLIEDAAEALGSEYQGRKCGTLGDLGVLSFNGNKIITTSGGGMLLCREKSQAQHVLKLATQAREPFPWYQHEEIGYNYRMSNIVAGIGRGQMKVLERRIEKKRAIAEGYRQGLAGQPLALQPENGLSNRWLTVITLDEGCGVTPTQVLAALNESDIEGRHVWKPMHLQPVFRDAGYVSASEASVSEDLFARGVCLPSDTKMTEGDVARVCAVIRGLFG